MHLDLTERQARLVQIALAALAEAIARPAQWPGVARSVRQHVDPTGATDDAFLLDMLDALADRCGAWAREEVEVAPVASSWRDDLDDWRFGRGGVS